MPYNPHTFNTGEIITQERINSLRIPEIKPDGSNSGKVLSSNGTDFAWITPSAGGSSRGLFFKANPSTVAFERTGVGSAIIKAGTIVDVDGTIVTFSASAAITMPTLAAGTDYAIWVKSDGTIEASSNHNTAPGSGSWRKIGGFHYAPGGNAVITAGVTPTGGNTTPQINEYSFWDLKFRPACPDPRGMTLVADSFWSDIYLTAQNAVTLGLTSAFNVQIADGSSPPLMPIMYGGNGTSTSYVGYNWFSASELASAFGKRLTSQEEYTSLAYGATNSSRGTDPIITQMSTTDAQYTSRWGVIQSVGCLWVLRHVLPGSTTAVILGGAWSYGSSSYRVSYWTHGNTASINDVGSRFCCNHLIAE